MDKRFTERSDPEIMVTLGRRLAALRKSRGLNQSQAGDRAGVGRTTVSRAERGDNPNLLTVIRLLRVYGRLDALDGFIPEAEVSPMDLVRASKRGRG